MRNVIKVAASTSLILNISDNIFSSRQSSNIRVHILALFQGMSPAWKEVWILEAGYPGPNTRLNQQCKKESVLTMAFKIFISQGTSTHKATKEW
jgi:hypothetical protein